jgi:hypothetical protein
MMSHSASLSSLRGRSAQRRKVAEERKEEKKRGAHPFANLCVFAPLRCRQRILTALALLFLCSVLTGELRAEKPAGTSTPAGSHISLLKAWPKIGQAPKSEIATIEYLIRPDQAALERPRSFVLILSNSGGRDAAGLSLNIGEGAIVAGVFGTRLKSKPLRAGEWTHVALTVNTKTVNKRARLWIDGKLAGESLVLEYWPKSFEVAQMLSDKWNLGRVYSGELGDVRISKTVRYTKPFEPPTALPKDDETTLRLDGRRLPLE